MLNQPVDCYNYLQLVVDTKNVAGATINCSYDDNLGRGFHSIYSSVAETLPTKSE